LIYFSLSKQEKIDSNKVVLAMKIVESTETLKDAVKGAEKKKNALVAEFRDSQEVLLGRCNWIDIFNELQLKIPDKMWLVNVIPGKDPSGGAAAAGDAGDEARSVVMPIFARKGPVRGTPVVDATKLEWLEFEGYFFGAPSEIDNFKLELAKTSVFTDKPAEIVTLSFAPARDDKNDFSSFKMTIKLKTPFIR
jgi:hypothetical protein